MKKVIVILIVALVVLSSASAFKFKSAGFAMGLGFLGGYVDMEIVDNLDVYAGAGYAGCFAAVAGIEYKVASFKLGETPVSISPGIQTCASFFDGMAQYGILGACSFSFGTKDLTAFIRPCAGLDLFPSKDETGHTLIDMSFAWDVDVGFGYLF